MIFDTSWLEAGQKYATSFVAFVPAAAKLSVLSLRVDLVVDKGDRLVLGNKPWTPGARFDRRGTAQVIEWDVKETSLIHRLTRHHRRLLVGAVVKEPRRPVEPLPHLVTYLELAGKGYNARDDARLQKEYSIADDFAVAEAPFSPQRATQ